MSKAIEDIITERQRQIEIECWTPEHDDEHVDGAIALAAASYAWSSVHKKISDTQTAGIPPGFWPWDWKWWKPKNPRRDLVRAGALIIAEIERIDRSAMIAAKGGRGKPLVTSTVKEGKIDPGLKRCCHVVQDDDPVCIKCGIDTSTKGGVG